MAVTTSKELDTGVLQRVGGDRAGGADVTGRGSTATSPRRGRSSGSSPRAAATSARPGLVDRSS